MKETTAGTSDNTDDNNTGNYLLGDLTVASSSFNVKTPISSLTIKTTPISSFPVEISVSYFNEKTSSLSFYTIQTSTSKQIDSKILWPVVITTVSVLFFYICNCLYLH